MRTLLIILMLFYASTVTAEDRTIEQRLSDIEKRLAAIESDKKLSDSTITKLQIVERGYGKEITKLKLRYDRLEEEISTLKLQPQYQNTMDSLKQLNDQMEKEYQRDIAEIDRRYAEMEASANSNYQQDLNDIEVDALRRRIIQLEQNQQWQY